MTNTEITQLIDSRDLRQYGLRGFDNRDSAVLVLQAAAEPVEKIAALATMFKLALPNMDEMAVAEMVADLRRCGPRPVQVSA